MKIFAFELFKIPGKSMEDAIFPDDVVLVDKLSYKFQSVKRGDVLVFKLAKGGFIAKRCIGMPGENISLINGDVYIDQRKYQNPLTVKMEYLIQLSGKRNFYRFIDSLNVQNQVYKDSINRYHGNLSEREVNSIKWFPYIKKFTKVNNQEYSFFLNELYPDWTLSDFGPLKVPKKGMVIELNKMNFVLYKRLLIEYEHLRVEEINGKYYADGREIKNIVLKNNYYFVMGDNRGVSVDSRYYGFISEELILGKVKIVLFSHRKGILRSDDFSNL